MNIDLVIGNFYGFILGLVGNIMVDCFIQKYYPEGMSQKTASWGLLGSSIVILMGFFAVIYIGYLL